MMKSEPNAVTLILRLGIVAPPKLGLSVFVNFLKRTILDQDILNLLFAGFTFLEIKWEPLSLSETNMDYIH